MVANEPILPKFLVEFAESQLTDQVLPFWTSFVVNPDGGMYGAVDANGRAIEGAEQSALMVCRALWSYSSAALTLESSSYIRVAHHIYQTLSRCFQNKKSSNHGVFWAIDCHQQATTETHHLLAQTYAVFALAKYYEASNNANALISAHALVGYIEKHFRRLDGSYRSEIGSNMPADYEYTIATCNQLHTMEAYTQLYLVSPTIELKKSLSTLISQFIDHLLPTRGHLSLAFDQKWQPLPGEVSIGHNFEAPWLVCLACIAIGETDLLPLAKTKLLQLIDTSLATGQHESGSIYMSLDAAGEPHLNMTWWQQTEASNALYTALMLTGDKKYQHELNKLWQAIENHWVDNCYGEWHSELDLTLQPNRLHHKADTWRSTYHITRACLLLSKGWLTMTSKRSHSNNMNLMRSVAGI